MASDALAIEKKKAEFLTLLDAKKGEQEYQNFLEENTRFISREFVQNHGIASSLVLRKLSFGADFKTDFFYFSKSTDDWHAVFIEIEKPSSKFFRGSTNVFHADFVHALQQINQWRSWFLSDQNKATFLSNVSAIQIPRHMARNPTYNKFVLVFGRREEYENNEDRRRLINAAQADDFKIISFDSLAEGLAGKYDVSIGSRHNDFIDILTEEITDPGLYAWAEPTQLRVCKATHEKMLNGPPSNHFLLIKGKSVEVLGHAAGLVRVRAK